MTITTDLTVMRTILAEARTIAILGAHHARERAAFYVPDYLAAMGYRVLPVNPALVGTELFGEPVRASLGELDGPVDVVDVFRASRHLPGHLDALLALTPAPRCVWFQLGVRHDDVAAALSVRGITVVQDRCTLAEHRRFGLPPIAPAAEAP